MNKVSKMSAKSKFSNGLVHVFVKKSSLLPCGFFLGRPRKKRSLFTILDRKEYFLEQKSEVSKTCKKSNFSKGLVHGICQKIERFTMRVF